MAEKDSSQEIAVINDEQGLLFLGDQKAITAFLNDNHLASRAFTVRAAGTAGVALKVAGEVAESSGRWVKLTKESAELVKQYGKKGALQPGVVQKKNGQIVKWLKFESPGDLFSPAMAAGVGGMMAQMALEQSIREITDYLADIDEKVSDLLRDQKDQTIADLMGVALELDEAAAIRSKTGTLNEAAWSKVAPCAQTTSRALAYALTKLSGIAEKLAKAGNVDELDHVLGSAHDDTALWFAVVAQAVQTRDKLSVLELERALAEAPEVIEEHRSAIVEARKERVQRVRSCIDQFRDALERSAETARGDKLLHPIKADQGIEKLEDLLTLADQFAQCLDLEMDARVIEHAQSWDKVVGQFVGEAAADAVDLGSKALEGAAELGGKALEGAQGAGSAIGKGASDLGSAVGKSAADLGSALADGAQQFGDALKGVDPGKITKSLPFKLPFGK